MRIDRAWRGAVSRWALVLTVLGACLSQPAMAQGDEAAKHAAVDRYLKAVPMSRMMEDSYAQLALQLPPQRRERFLADMRALVKVDRMEQIARTAMVRTFTLDELNAMADFYTSPHGASAMAKFGHYMGEIMPPLMQEIGRAVQELEAGNQRPAGGPR